MILKLDADLPSGISNVVGDCEQPKNEIKDLADSVKEGDEPADQKCNLCH
jgi:hypothetical protein